jgi:hypothetical protein
VHFYLVVKYLLLLLFESSFENHSYILMTFYLLIKINQSSSILGC